MKFVVIGPVAPYKGGISQFNGLLIENLKKDNEVKAISWKRRFPSFLYPGKNQIDPHQESLLKDTSTFVLDLINPFTWVKACSLSKREKPQVVIFHWVTPFLGPFFWFMTKLIKKKDVKILFVCHNALPHERRWFDVFLTKLAFRHVDYCIVHSSQDRKKIASLSRNVKIIDGFHPTYEVFKRLNTPLDLREQLSLRKKTLLFFGFVRDYKGLDVLLRAMPQVLATLDCDLLIVGEFWGDKEKYMHLIDKLGIKNNVKIVDAYVPDKDVGNYFAASDVVVLPYISATQSGIIQLAFGLGKPVITTDVGGLGDVVTHDHNGLLVPAKDPHALAQAILTFYTDKKQEQLVKGVELEKDKYSWKSYVDLISRL